MLKLFGLGTLFFVVVVGQNASDKAPEVSLQDDDIQLQDKYKLQDGIELSDELDSDIRSRSNNKKREHSEDYDYQEYESKPRKRPNNGGSNGREKTASPKKHRERDREPQRGPLITRDDICYRLKLNVLRDFEQYIDLYIDKCKINSI